jgi:hypothetical protein
LLKTEGLSRAAQVERLRVDLEYCLVTSQKKRTCAVSKGQCLAFLADEMNPGKRKRKLPASRKDGTGTWQSFRET